MSNNQLSNSPVLSGVEGPINQLSNLLINQFTCPEQRRRTSSPVLSKVEGLINFLQRARKKNKNMQNKANFKITRNDISTCMTNTYGNIIALKQPKNKAKQSQFKPNFSPKLASFSPKLALFRDKIVAFWHSLRSKFGRGRFCYNIVLMLTLTKRMRKRSCGRVKFAVNARIKEQIGTSTPKSAKYPVILSKNISVESVKSVAKDRLVQIRETCPDWSRRNSWLKFSVNYQEVKPRAAIWLCRIASVLSRRAKRATRRASARVRRSSSRSILSLMPSIMSDMCSWSIWIVPVDVFNTLFSKSSIAPVKPCFTLTVAVYTPLVLRSTLNCRPFSGYTGSPFSSKVLLPVMIFELIVASRYVDSVESFIFADEIAWSVTVTCTSYVPAVV